MTQDPTLLWACLSTGSGNNAQEDPAHCLKVWKDRRDLLRSKGISLKLAVPHKILRKPGLFPVIDVLEREHPDWLLGFSTEGVHEQERIYSRRINWPRDNFQIIGDTAYSTHVDYHATINILNQLGVDLKTKASRVGEGGMSVGANGVRVFADRVSPEAVEEVATQGYQTYTMPTDCSPSPKIPQTLYQEALWDRMCFNHHIDTELNIAETPDGNMALVVNREYYEVFPSEVNRLREELDAQVHVVDNLLEISGKAVNFIQLPSCDVLVPREHSNMVGFLERVVGKSRVHRLETFDKEYSHAQGGGGMRCRTNLIY